MLDASQYGALFDSAGETIEVLREFQGDIEYPIDHRQTLRVGCSSQCEISIPGRGLSRVHFVLERRGKQLLLHDQDAVNGVIVRGRRLVGMTALEPGDCFTAVPMTFVAMNRAMRLQRPVLVRLLGHSGPTTADHLMIEAAQNLSGLVITGEPGSEHRVLAKAVHAMSMLRDQPLVDLGFGAPLDEDVLRKAARATLVITVGEKTPALDDVSIARLFSQRYHLRLIVLAPDLATARRVLHSDELHRMRHIEIPSIRGRRAELPSILDELLIQHNATIRLADFSLSNRDRLLRYGWRKNWDELRIATERLAIIGRTADWEQMDWRERAAAHGVAKSTLYDWFKGLGLTSPLLAVR